MGKSLVILSCCSVLFCCVPRAEGQSESEQLYVPRAKMRPASTPACSEIPREDADPRLCIPASGPNTESEEVEAVPIAPVKIALKIPEGTPLRIAVDERARILNTGEAVHGRIVEPVYAFDQVVIPAGTIAMGKVTSVAPLSGARRTLAYTSGNFSPLHQYEVGFDKLTLPDGKEIAIQTTVSPGMADVVHLVSHPENEKQKNAAGRATDKAKQEAGSKVQEAKSEAHETWEKVKAPGKMQRLKQLVVGQSPYRRQYLEVGTRFNASLKQELDFGETTRTQEQLAAIGGAPEPESLLHARFVAEVSSANSTRGTPIAAVLTEPVFSADHHLILPANSRLVGEVLQARPARKMHHNGELRVVFERVETAEGSAQTMQGNLEGVEVDRAEGVKLDEEGGARATDSKKRYLSTALVVGLALLSNAPEEEHGTVNMADSSGKQAGAGYAGTRLTGALIGMAVRSAPLSIAFGAYGSGNTIYRNFLSRGHDVVFPKDTPLEVGFGTPRPAGNLPKPKDGKDGKPAS